jgi:hypothetical protein
LSNALYKVTPGQTQPPLASDINQYADALNGNADIGQITLAAPISAPSSAGITGAAATGTALGIGTYRYQFTYVVGIKKSDNTVVLGGETTPSASISVTTTTGNQAVTLSGLPTTWPSTAVALRIYRTAVGGADGTQKLVTTITVPVATYTDTTADGALGATVPTTNTTGTTFSGPLKTTNNTLDDGSGNVTLKGGLTTKNNILDDGTGQAGFGMTSAPAAKVHIADQNNAGFEFDEYSAVDGAVMRLKRARGTSASPAAIQSGDVLGAVRGFGYNSSGAFNTSASGKIDFVATENHTSTAQGAKIQFSTVSNGTVTQTVRLTIDQNGAVTTTNNTLDNGSGAATITGQLTYQGTVMPQLRYTNGYVEWNNGGTWQGVGGVKNVQRGSVSLTANSQNQTINITISSVNMAKTFVTFNNTFSGTGSNGSLVTVATANLTSATNLQIFYTNLTSTALTFYWEVVESY